MSTIQTAVAGVRSKVVKVSPDQKDQWEQDQPQQVDHVPKARRAFEKRPLIRRECRPVGHRPHDDEHGEPDHEVEQVQPGEHEG
jgi:hypothetical protein